MTDVAFVVFAAGAVLSGYRVFATDSMIRASFLLLASFLNVGAILVLLLADYLGTALIFMMTVEMVVMALFMMMFMMNPAGLNPMAMVHQPRAAAAAGVVAAAGIGVVAVIADFPDDPVDAARDATVELGTELLGGSMLVFESAGVTLLATMVCAVILSSSRGRFGDDDEGSLAPPLEPGGDRRPEDDLVPADIDPHAGHGGMDHGDMGGMDHSAMGHGSMSGMSHGEMDHSDMDHGAMGGMDHSEMDHSGMEENAHGDPDGSSDRSGHDDHGGHHR